MNKLMEYLGIVLVLTGLAAGIYFLAFFEVSVDTPFGRVVNLPRMNDRSNGMTFGFGAAILGALMFIGGHVAATIQKSNSSQQAGNSSDPKLPRGRATFILTLGLISMMPCALLGPLGVILGSIAVSMGNKHIEEIKAGRLDPASASAVSAGRLAGKIARSVGLLLTIIVVLLVVLLRYYQI